MKLFLFQVLVGLKCCRSFKFVEVDACCLRLFLVVQEVLRVFDCFMFFCMCLVVLGSLMCLCFSVVSGCSKLYRLLHIVLGFFKLSSVDLVAQVVLVCLTPVMLFHVFFVFTSF